MSSKPLPIETRRFSIPSSSLLFIAVAAVAAVGVTRSSAEEHRVVSPDGTLAAIVSDENGLSYRVEVDSKPILLRSQLGLELSDAAAFGPMAKSEHVQRSKKDATWQNTFGKRRTVVERWNQMRLTLRETDSEECRFGLTVRVFDDGIAFRYELGEASQLAEFTLTGEQTQFVFCDDHRCWMGLPSKCAENQYPETTVGAIPDKEPSGNAPYQSVVPLLVQTPHCFVAVSESDVRDWAGMFLSGSEGSAVRVTLDQRNDGRGCVIAQTPCVSPWRVLMIGRTAADLVNSDLIANLATPCQLDDISWIKPGLCAWDPWWTGVNPYLPEHEGLWARGNTQAHMDYIDFAAEMGWSYQLVDWFWYKNMSSYEVALNKGGDHPPSPPVDFTQSMPYIDLPAIFVHAKQKGVRLIIWLHSYDLDRYGIDRACKLFADMGAAGLKIDFMNSDSQETMQWYEEVVRTAARHHLLVNFHGACKPSGLSRTYPNYITQEGVLGNEYNKLEGNLCTPLHTITLPFTRGLLGPMDFTPGGFLAVAEADFEITSPTRVMGTRTRQLAMPVDVREPVDHFL